MANRRVKNERIRIIFLFPLEDIRHLKTLSANCMRFAVNVNVNRVGNICCSYIGVSANLFTYVCITMFIFELNHQCSHNHQYVYIYIYIQCKMSESLLFALCVFDRTSSRR